MSRVRFCAKTSKPSQLCGVASAVLFRDRRFQSASLEPLRRKMAREFEVIDWVSAEGERSR